MKQEKLKTVNLKFDNETKSKLETLAYIKRCSIQDLCLNILKKELDANADKIATVENLRE